jgi:hypothetical protein
VGPHHYLMSHSKMNSEGVGLDCAVVTRTPCIATRQRSHTVKNKAAEHIYFGTRALHTQPIRWLHAKDVSTTQKQTAKHRCLHAATQLRPAQPHHQSKLPGACLHATAGSLVANHTCVSTFVSLSCASACRQSHSWPLLSPASRGCMSARNAPSSCARGF